MFISIVIALYNEEKNVLNLTNRLYHSMDQLKIPFNLIYVIDGNDQTYPFLQQYKKEKKLSNLILSYSATPRGFGPAFTTGFHLISPQATHILTMDGDLNHQPEEIHRLVDEMNSHHPNIVIGSRHVGTEQKYESPLWKKTISALANSVMRVRFKLKVKDKTSGFRLYTREALLSLLDQIRSRNFEYLMEILIRAARKGYTFTEVPITFKQRIHGESKLPLLKTAKGYCRLLFRA
ncbi:TPA: glycosyltransferase [Candidatus Woesearchaeota archaeon]|nr:glycosyltransferase [Candidatus Woesearchaeota archaeon]